MKNAHVYVKHPPVDNLPYDNRKIKVFSDLTYIFTNF